LEGAIERINPAVLWDLEPMDGDRAAERVPEAVRGLLEQRSAVEDHVVTRVLLPFREEIGARRERETRVKEKYGLRSLEYLIQESNQKILDYQMRQAAGEQVELPLLNEQRTLERLTRRRDELERELRQERNLTVGEPRFLGAAAVVPLPVAGPEELAYDVPRPEAVPAHEERAGYGAGYGAGMRRDDEIEAVGMQVAMAYEREQGWEPEDVSGENHGFDVRSIRYDEDGTLAGVRYIEVKARARSGAVRISSNEWKKARHFGEQFWLYVVTQAGTESPQLHRIQDPATRFRMDEDIFATGFIVPEDRWQETAA
jgi:hypothetical protein